MAIRVTNTGNGKGILKKGGKEIKMREYIHN